MDTNTQKIEVQDEMERFMQLHKFNSIQEVVKTPVEILLKMDGFGYRMLKYYILDKKQN
jgi:hypothetical protein